MTAFAIPDVVMGMNGPKPGTRDGMRKKRRVP
jgi:hypothetical protein